MKKNIADGFICEINDIMDNSINMISTKEEGDFIIINNETCLFKGQMEKLTNDDKKVFIGKGELYLKNGVKYKGILIDGKLNGIGRYINEKFICYEGILQDK